MLFYNRRSDSGVIQIHENTTARKFERVSGPYCFLSLRIISICFRRWVRLSPPPTFFLFDLEGITWTGSSVYFPCTYWVIRPSPPNIRTSASNCPCRALTTGTVCMPRCTRVTMFWHCPYRKLGLAHHSSLRELCNNAARPLCMLFISSAFLILARHSIAVSNSLCTCLPVDHVCSAAPLIGILEKRHPLICITPPQHDPSLYRRRPR